MVEQMYSIGNIRSVPASSKVHILKFLAVHAFFVVDKAAVGKVGFTFQWYPKRHIECMLLQQGGEQAFWHFHNCCSMS